MLYMLAPDLDKRAEAHRVGDIDGCEIFAGVGAVADAMRSLGYVMATADINISSCFDITTSAGFLCLGVLFR